MQATGAPCLHLPGAWGNLGWPCLLPSQSPHPQAEPQQAEKGQREEPRFKAQLCSLGPGRSAQGSHPGRQSLGRASGAHPLSSHLPLKTRRVRPGSRCRPGHADRRMLAAGGAAGLGRRWSPAAGSTLREALSSSGGGGCWRAPRSGSAAGRSATAQAAPSARAKGKHEPPASLSK